MILMKGFLYLIEIAIAAVLVLFSFITLFSMTNVKENWERYDIFSYKAQISKLSAYNLIENHSYLDSFLPEIYDFDIFIEGISPNKINVGCINCNDNQYKTLVYWLSPMYINGRWINFTVYQVTSEQINNYDIAVFMDKNDFDIESDQYIIQYLKEDKPLLAITKPSSQMIKNFSLQISEQEITLSRPYLIYNLSNGKTSKYFFGHGLNINTSSNSITCPTDLKGKCKYGFWNYSYIYRYGMFPYNYNISNFMIYTNSSHVYIKNISLSTFSLEFDGQNINPFINFNRPLLENDTFQICFKNNICYIFKIKKIYGYSSVIIQPLNNSFSFSRIFNFSLIESDSQCVKSTKNMDLLIYNSYCSASVKNGNKIWIASPTLGNEENPEYSLLIKSAIISLIQNYEIKQSTSQIKKYTTLTFFKSLCCDIPESFKIVLKIWYKI